MPAAQHSARHTAGGECIQQALRHYKLGSHRRHASSKELCPHSRVGGNDGPPARTVASMRMMASTDGRTLNTTASPGCIPSACRRVAAAQIALVECGKRGVAPPWRDQCDVVGRSCARRSRVTYISPRKRRVSCDLLHLQHQVGPSHGCGTSLASSDESPSLRCSVTCEGKRTFIGCPPRPEASGDPNTRARYARGPTDATGGASSARACRSGGLCWAL